MKNFDVILLVSLAKFVSHFLQRKWYTVKSKTKNNKTVTGIAIDKNVSKITVKKIKNVPGTAASILKPLSDRSISIDVIVQNIPMDGYIDFSFSVYCIS